LLQLNRLQELTDACCTSDLHLCANHAANLCYDASEWRPAHAHSSGRTCANEALHRLYIDTSSTFYGKDVSTTLRCGDLKSEFDAAADFAASAGCCGDTSAKSYCAGKFSTVCKNAATWTPSVIPYEDPSTDCEKFAAHRLVNYTMSNLKCTDMPTITDLNLVAPRCCSDGISKCEPDFELICKDHTKFLSKKLLPWEDEQTNVYYSCTSWLRTAMTNDLGADPNPGARFWGGLYGQVPGLLNCNDPAAKQALDVIATFCCSDARSKCAPNAGFSFGGMPSGFGGACGTEQYNVANMQMPWQQEPHLRSIINNTREKMDRQLGRFALSKQSELGTGALGALTRMGNSSINETKGLGSTVLAVVQSSVDGVESVVSNSQALVSASMDGLNAEIGQMGSDVLTSVEASVTGVKTILDASQIRVEASMDETLVAIKAMGDSVYNAVNSSVSDVQRVLEVGQAETEASMDALRAEIDGLGVTVVGSVNTSVADVKALLVQSQGETEDEMHALILESAANMTTMTAEMQAASSISIFNTVRLMSEKTVTVTTSGLSKVKYLIGTIVGFQVFAKLIPFSLGISSGIVKGVIEFETLVKKSGAFQLEEDQHQIHNFMALMMLVAGAVGAIPTITIMLFFYQVFASQEFVLVVLGVQIMTVNNAIKGFLASRTATATSVLAYVLIVAGILLWALRDEEGILKMALFTPADVADAVVKNAATVLLSFGDLVFNFFFSKLVTCNVIANLAARMFTHRNGVRVQYIDIGKDGTPTVRASQLHHLDLWGKGRKTHLAGGGRVKVHPAGKDSAFEGDLKLENYSG
jgi:hypothetical protein